MFKNCCRFALLVLLPVSLALASCETIDLYEKNVSVPDHQWAKSFRPQFRFNITDTVSPYRLFIVLRHNEKYNYNNIWLSLSTRVPGDSSIQKVQYELPLANSEGWVSTASAMDDLYEHRIPVTPVNEYVYFNKAGEYIYTIEQIMRDDPLPHVLNIGLRLEKQSVTGKQSE